MSFDVPVLLLTWRRPETTRQVLEALRLVSPSKLYVASDGPRNDAEAKAVQETRDLITEFIDWPCQLKTRFCSENQGCQLGVSSAISWFFEQEESGIILEDDCVPHPDFFLYCRELLERYRYDTRIWCISGDNFQDGVWRGEGSYYFSRYNHCWGWASWRRCWSQYAYNDEIWKCVRASISFREAMFDDPVERDYWVKIWERLFETGIPDTWDYRWSLVCMANSGLTALPNRNLVTNIGFGDGATHTFEQIDQPIVKELGPLSHPRLICRDSKADDYTFLHHFGGLELRRGQTMSKVLMRRIKSLIKKLFKFNQ